MAKIAWMIPSQGVFNNHQGGLVIESPLSFIELEALPNNFSFNILKEKSIKDGLI
ncbi:hypothetical protein GZH82_02820 [Staphylococcus ursi]|uniref:hypothetical protein n=1 Tax=Staphylococcus sp. MI 10-1553 TaxID=1912064 RepID=UPI0013981A15|nr:hypothetical protein [Staphylococcus sp. MI 10-1553]QHW36371.1 hypothetical protein GZH82_02820 [Staphylococcus sp. MI 10-1553]